MKTPGGPAWREIVGRPSAFAPECRWSVDWQVRVHYEKPDGLVAGGQGDFFFVDRHVRPDVRLDASVATREMPGLDESPLGCAVSAASLPRAVGTRHGGELFASRGARTAHQRDWDFLVEARDSLLGRKGLAASVPTRGKVDALAACFSDGSFLLGAKADFTRGFHPVDVLLHGQHCTGLSSALAALCHTMGVPARPLNFAGHSVCEVCVDGRWLLYDNQVDQVAAARSYMEEVADPYSSRLTPKRARSYHWMMNTGGARHLVVGKGKWPNHIEAAPFNLGAQRWWRFNAAGLGATQRVLSEEGGHGFTLPLCPDTARALYPNEPRHLFKYNSIEPCRVALNLPHSWFLAPLPLRSAASVRKVFWLGELGGATKVTTFLAAAPGTMWRLRAPYDRAWRVRINGETLPLGDPSLEAGFVHHGFQITLPVGRLRERVLNEVVLDCAREVGEEVTLALYPDLLEPYAPPWGGQDLPRLPLDRLSGTHAADSYSAHVPS